MKQLGLIFRYYFGCSWILTLLPLIGLLSLALHLLILITGTELTTGKHFGWSLLTLLLLAGIPFLTTAVNARVLLASRPMILLPKFASCIGLSLLLFTLLVTLPPPLLALLLLPDAPTFLHLFALLFIIASTYLGITNIVLGSRINIHIINCLMVALALFMLQYGRHLLHWLWQPAITASVFMFIIAGWCYSFYRLSRQRSFHLNSFNHGNAQRDPWQSISGFSMYNLGGSIATPAGTLALGYPDSLSAKFMRLALGMIVIPLVNLAFMLSFSTGEESAWLFLRICILISLLFAMLTSLQHGEMAAQMRALWLRFSGDRQTLWQFLERIIWQYLLLTAAILTVIAIAVFSFTELPRIHLQSFSMALIASVYAAYLTLFCRIRNNSIAAVILIAICSLGAMMITTMLGLFSEEHLAASYLPALILQLAFLALTLALRYGAKHSFSTIDWIQVKCCSRKTRQDNLVYES